jgi:hypothetical protein
LPAPVTHVTHLPQQQHCVCVCVCVLETDGSPCGLKMLGNLPREGRALIFLMQNRK